MAIVKFELSLSEGIRWPQECAVCGGPAGRTARASCSVSRNLRYRVVYLGWTQNRVSVSYPVCSKHRWLAWALGAITQRSLVNLAIGFLVTFFFAFGVILPLVAWFANGIRLENPSGAIYMFIIFVVVLGVFLWSQRSVPVRIKDVTDETMKLWFARPGFASAFLRLNEPAATAHRKST
jgi:hypothetical protein